MYRAGQAKHAHDHGREFHQECMRTVHGFRDGQLYNRRGLYGGKSPDLQDLRHNLCEDCLQAAFGRLEVVNSDLPGAVKTAT